MMPEFFLHNSNLSVFFQPLQIVMLLVYNVKNTNSNSGREGDGIRVSYIRNITHAIVCRGGGSSGCQT